MTTEQPDKKAAEPGLEFNDQGALVWTAPMPLLNNPVIWRALAIGLGGTALLLCIMFGIVAPAALLIIPLFVAGFVALTVLFCLALGNRMLMRYGLFEEGYASEIADRRVSWLFGASTGVGAATRDPTLAGAGLIGFSSRRQFQPWTRVDDMRLDAQSRRIELHLGWRGRDMLFCTDDSYDLAAERAKQLFERHNQSN